MGYLCFVKVYYARHCKISSKFYQDILIAFSYTDLDFSSKNPDENEKMSEM